MIILPYIFDFNIITSILSVSKPFLVLILREGFSHLGLTSYCHQSEILLAGFRAGALQFISMRYDQFI